MAPLACLSASSFALWPTWAFIYVKSMRQISFSKSVVFLLISLIKYFLFLAFLSDNTAMLLSVGTLTVRGVLLSKFIVSDACSALSIAVCSAWLFEHLLLRLCLIWRVNLLFTCMAIPDPTPCSVLLPSVYIYICIVCSVVSFCSMILTVSAAWVQSWWSVSWSSGWFCLSLVILYISAASSVFSSTGSLPVRMQSASLEVVR